MTLRVKFTHYFGAISLMLNQLRHITLLLDIAFCTEMVVCKVYIRLNARGHSSLAIGHV